MVGQQRLTFEEMSTITCQVESYLNSRPLGSFTSHSPDGILPLTPGHFLIGRPLQAYPEITLTEDPSLLKRWTLCQSFTQHFWQRWSREYLQQLQRAGKWHKRSPNLKEGDLVMMTDGNVFQAQWTMAKVISVYKGQDDLVRAVDVQVVTAIQPQTVSSKTQLAQQMTSRTAIYRRPVHKLALLLLQSLHQKDQTRRLHERSFHGPGGC